MTSMNGVFIKDTPQYVGGTVTVSGWVHSIRDMGKMAFIDVRDQSGLLQVVIPSDDLPRVGSEWVIEVEGVVQERGERFVNPKLVTGSVEVSATEIRVLSHARELPIEVSKDTRDINEEVRLQYRYLDLRSERMQTNLRFRHRVMHHVRNFLSDNEFVEVETPLLTKGTPEGAREFLVPSRLHPGKFYVLPQSPQQFKQLLMVGGIGRYFQIAKAFRDEDQRGDRQPEHTQIDMELSFVDQETIFRINEDMLTTMVATLLPEHHVSQQPFPRLTHSESMERYGSDKPDLRQNPDDPGELAFAWIVDFPLFEQENEGSGITSEHHPFTAPHPDDVDMLSQDPLSVRSQSFDLVLNGYELGSGSIRISDAQLQSEIFSVLGMSDEEIEHRFGHILEAFRYGVPPHGGIALGLDRLLMVFANEPNIREVIAFPKTGDARDPMMGAPGDVSDNDLRDVHITTRPDSQ